MLKVLLQALLQPYIASCAYHTEWPPNGPPQNGRHNRIMSAHGGEPGRRSLGIVIR
jgi:hypothetical protein